MKKLQRILLTLATVFAMMKFIERNVGADIRNDKGRKHQADSPADLPARGWKTALRRTKEALKDKNLPVSAAGVAFYTTLTFFPALLGAAAIYATFADPRGLTGVIESLRSLVPEAIYDLVRTQLSPLAEAGRQSVGVAAILSVAALLWTTSGALQNLVKALNEAYDVRESRGFVRLRLLNMALSVVLLALGGLIIAILLLQADALRHLGVPSVLADSFVILRWPLLVLLISLVLSVIYRYAPNRSEPKWSWVSWGATAATVIWLAATALFFLYAQNFGNFNETYGTFAGIIVLMTWFNVSSLVVLLGAQVNQKLESMTD